MSDSDRIENEGAAEVSPPESNGDGAPPAQTSGGLGQGAQLAGTSGRLLPDDRGRPVFAVRPRARVAGRSSTCGPPTGSSSAGEFVEPLEGGAYKTENPASEEVLAEIAAAGTR